MSEPGTLEHWSETGQRFDWRDHSMFYIDQRPAGNKEPPVVLCIHGYPTASWDFHKIIPTLLTKYRVIAPDMLGFGFSAKPTDHDYSIIEQADFHETLMTRLNIRHAHVLAHDYGVSVAQELLSRRLDGTSPGFKLRSTCFLNGGLFPDLHRPRPVQKLLAGRAGPLLSRFLNERIFAMSFRQVFGPDSQPDAKEIAEFWALINFNNGKRVAHKLIAYMEERRRHADLWAGAMEFTNTPLALINGLLDPVSGEHVLERFRQTCPNAEVVELPDVGHYPQVEAPDRVGEAVMNFFGGVAKIGG